MSYLERLNPEQKQAARHFEGPMLVLAGAGSGKTRVLTTRVAHLVEEYGVDPANILALTFTNKAAGEMRERIRSLLGSEPSGMWIGTFHAVGARLLRRHSTQLGWPPNFLIYDADDSERVIRRIMKNELQLDPKRWSPRGVKSAISAAKNELTGVQEYADAAVDVFQRTVAQVYERYQRALRDANAFDFDDLLVKPVELFRAFPQVLSRYRERFPFVLVDEYQDTNRAQYVFLRLLTQRQVDVAGAAGHGTAADPHRRGAPDEGGGNIFVVGDDDQSIYGWRGADIRNILDFEKDFADAVVVRLEQNYRSTQRILAAANRVIEQNVQRKGKTLRTANDEGEPITLVETADEADEADWIANETQARTAENPDLSPRDIVILYRTNAQSRALEEALRRRGLGYRIVGGQRFYERREVKDVLAYVRLVANPADDEAFLRIFNVPRRGVGDASVARLAEWATERRLPLLQAAARAAEIDSIRGPAKNALPELAAMLQKLSALAERGIALEEILREIVARTGLEDALREEGPEGEDRIDNVAELIAGAADLQVRFDEGDPDLVLEIGEADALRAVDVFLAHVALIADIDQHDSAAEAISLMTLHNAKGLEFPLVFVGGLEDGLFPLSRAYDEPAELEEERRLFYVGITRAERKLYLTYAKRRRRGREWMDTIPSSFLEALPEELLDVRRSTQVQLRSSQQRPWRSAESYTPRRQRLGFATPPTEPEPEPSSDGRVVDYADSQEEVRLIKGARVRHPQFGAGTVAEVSGVGTNVRATIDFDSVGRKQVVVRYANLQQDWD